MSWDIPVNDREAQHHPELYNNAIGGSFTTDYTPQFGRDRFKGGHLPEDIEVYNPYDSTTFHMLEFRKDRLGPND